MKKQMNGMIYGIGVGPGASDLVTVRAVNILQQVDVIYAPFSQKTGNSLALSIVETYIPKETEIRARHFAMNHERNEKEKIWQKVADEMIIDAKDGKKVAFISLGDSMLYSTWVSLLELIPSSITVEVVPGITSFSAIASIIHYPLAMEQESVKILSCTAEKRVLIEAVKSEDNLVLMKAGTNFPFIYELLDEYNLLDQAILVSNAALENEICVLNLKDIDKMEKRSYFSTILLNRTWKKKR